MESKTPFGIIASAWKIDDERIANFIEWNREVFERENVDLCLVSDRQLDIEYGRTVVYPVEQDIFSIPRTINFGLRTFSEGVVAKTDIDIIWSAELINHVREVVKSGEVGYIGICVDVGGIADAVGYAKRTKRRRGRGACLALHIDDWNGICGYNENIRGWGGDDEDCWKRACQSVNMLEEWVHPIYHVRHPNRKGNPDFPILSRSNMSISRKKGWNNPDWGKPQI